MEYYAVFAESYQDFRDYLDANIKKEKHHFYIFVDRKEKTQGINFIEILFTDKMKMYQNFLNLYQDVNIRLNRPKKY